MLIGAGAARSAGRDGARDDYFVLSGTFQLLDFSNTFVSPENFEFLTSYMRYYTELYIDPVRRKMAAQAGAAGKKPARRGGAGRSARTATGSGSPEPSVGTLTEQLETLNRRKRDPSFPRIVRARRFHFPLPKAPSRITL
jgi:hypothetical protein